MVRILAQVSDWDKVQGTHLAALIYMECSWPLKLAGERKVVAGNRPRKGERVPKGVGLGTSPTCILREAGQRCQRIERP